MLSTSSIGHAADATRYYFSQDNYYFKDSQSAQENSQWWGKGAAEWGLQGKVEKQDFKDLLRGHLPDGQKLGTIKEGEMQHRPGFDLTFSAPKSVSLLGLMSSDKPTRMAIEQAMLTAAKNSLGMIEETCSGARITQKGRTTFVKTHNLTVALFLHDLSREGDPQLHVHAVVMNMTKRPDGAWRSLASQIGDYGKNATRTLEGFFEQVRHDKLFYGTLFRAELAATLTELGFNLVVDEAKGFFEIEGISKAAREAYSTRAQQIQQHLQEHQLSGAAAAGVAALKTRPTKKTIDRDTLQILWEEKGQAAGIDAFKEVNELVTTLKQEKTTSRHEPNVSLLAKEALAYAIALHSENQHALSTMPLIQAAAQYAMGQVKLADLLSALEQLKMDGELMALDPTKDDHYTTPQSLGYEQKIVQAIGQASKPPRKLTPSTLNAFVLAQGELNREQKAAFRSIFGSLQRVQGIEGQSGTGKTTLIKPLVEFAHLLGMGSIVLTPSQSASLALEKTLRQAPRSLKEWFQTLLNNQHYASVAGFIKRTQGSTPYFGRPKIIVVDQAPLLSTKQMAELMTIAEKSKAFLILLGDQQGLSTWQSSNPFQLLIDHGMKTARLKRVIVKSSLHNAIQDTLAGHLNKAFARLNHRLLAIDDKDARLQAMATQFAALSPLAQSNALLLMPTRAACHEANRVLREALKNTQQLGASGTVVQALIPQPFKQAGAVLAENYTVGQWLRYKNQYLKIVDRFLPSNTLLLEDVRGKTHRLPLHKIMGRNNKLSFLEVFAETPRELATGDVLIWKRSDRAQSLSSGDRVTVLSCASHRLLLLGPHQKKLSLDLRDPRNRHFDYGYAITPFTAVGTKPHTVIGYQKATSRLSHQRAFYNLLNTARGEVWLYTENKTALLQSVTRYTGTTFPLLDQLLGDHKPSLSSTDPAMYFTQLEQVIAQILSQQKERLTLDKQSQHLPEEIAKEAVRYALAHLSEREAAFTYKSIVEVAVKHTLGQTTLDSVKAAIITAKDQGELLEGSFEGEWYWTTREEVQMEREIIALAKADQGALATLVDKTAVQQYLGETLLKPEHAEAVTTWTQSSDRVVMIEGYAGTQKTTLLQKVQPLLNKAGFQLETLAPTHAAVKELKARGLSARTLDSFLGTQAHSSEPSLHVIDENSMVSNRRMHRFLTLTKERDERGLLMGDRAQFPAIEAGNPHVLLQAAGITTATLTDIVRQESPVLLKAVQEIYQDNLMAAFETLKDCFVEVSKEEPAKGRLPDNPRLRFERIAKDYTALSAAERARTLVITGGNADREAINDAIRKQLKKQGELVGQGVESSIFVQQDRTPVQLTRASQYQVGQWIRFGRSALGIEAGTYLQVIEVHAKENWLTLQKPTGEKILWHPLQSARQSRVQLYASEKRELLPGDQLRWTRTDKKRELISPELVRAERIEKEKAWVTSLQITDKGLCPAGPERALPLNDLNYWHWDYAYALTGYAAQGKSIWRVLCNMDSYSRYLTNLRFFLIAVTRSIQQLTLYTDDKTKLLEKLIQTPAHKFTALEILGEIEVTPTKKDPAMRTQAYPKINQTSQQTHPSIQAKRSLDADRITQALHKNAAPIVKQILGEPKSHTTTHYQYSDSEQFGGNNHKNMGGSLSVAITGKNAGLWHSFKTGEGGNLLQLIQKKYGLDFPKSLEYASGLLALTPEPLSTHKEAPAALKLIINNTDKNNPKNWTPEQCKSLTYARRLARESKSIQGTLAERYLREHRGIHLHPLPKDIRFHPGIYSKINAAIHPALLAIARNKDGQVQAVQAIYLNEITANKAEVPVVKQTWGVLAESSVDLSCDKKPSPVYLAEGVETALSILQSIEKAQVKATLGKSNFAHSNVPKQTNNVVLCLDNDGVNPKSDALIHKIATAFIAQNKTVWIAKPTDIGKNYNDLLRDTGSYAVKTNLEKAIPFMDYRDATPQLTTTLGTMLRAFEKNNLLSDTQADSIKKSLDPYLNGADTQPIKSIDAALLVQTKKIKEVEIEL